MSLPWIVLVASIGIWGIIWIAFDSPVVPLWKTRLAYRYFILSLIISLTFIVWKATMIHTEVVQLITGCR